MHDSGGRRCGRGLILLTGASGYVGCRLGERLVESGRRVRCLVRRRQALPRHLAEAAEIIEGDVLDAAALARAVRDVEAAYYLIHSMGAPGDPAGKDRLAAAGFARATLQAGVGRIIYLGGLGHGSGLSPHLASRQEVGHILRESGVPTIEFRASIIIGSGSISFEMIRALVERLPVMVTPRWVSTLAQPIGVDDVIAYLTAALEIDVAGSAVFEIGGADRMSYLDLMKEYARQRGLRRLVVRVPVLTPWLSGLWLRLVTPLQARVGHRLIEGVRNETVVRDRSALAAFSVRPLGAAAAIARALESEKRELGRRRWMRVYAGSRPVARWGGSRRGGWLVDSTAARVRCPQPAAFRPMWWIKENAALPCCHWLWRLRMAIDRVIRTTRLWAEACGPPRGSLAEPGALWRVEAFEADRLIRLRARMRLPGTVWLQLEVEPESGGALIRQTVVFDPHGLAGLVYWYALYPLHRAVFGQVLRDLARRASVCERSYQSHPLSSQKRRTGAPDPGAESPDGASREESWTARVRSRG